MAEEQGLEKSELPSQRRREEARAQGQLAYSHELITGLLLLASAFGLSWGGAALARGLTDELHRHISRPHLEYSIDEASSLIAGLCGRGLTLVGGMIGGLFAVGLASSLAQAGLHFNSESLSPKWEKLNPAENWRRIFSWEGVTRGGFSAVKVGIVAFMAWWVLGDRGGQVISLAEGRLSQSVATVWSMALELMILASAAFAVLGAADYGLQWIRHEQRLKMTRQELKQEKKDDEGDPQILNKRRQRARELVSQRRMLEEVPKATLVITNPTHLAVALRYERGVMSAPVVIAKGRDQFALQIAAKARRHGIPVVERKPIARALFKTVKVGQEIPQALYIAVSEVLSYVYRLRDTSA